MFDPLAERPLLRRALVPASAFLGVSVAGVAGFSHLVDISLVQATFWLLDPTSIELHFEAHPGGPERVTKAYALVVFAGIVLTSIWTGETAIDAAFGGQVRDELEEIRMERALEELENHVIVCGYGMFGRTVAEQLVEAGRDVVVIERDEAILDRASADVLPLAGDARREETLQRAGVERAGSLVAGIDESNANIQITIIAGQLSPQCRLVARVGDEIYEGAARRAGADEVIIPEVTSGTEIAKLL